MLMLMLSSARNSPRPIKSLLYWRKSKVNGAATVPVILSLDTAGLLSMQDADLVTMFAVPAHEAVVRFTSWGTMVLTIHGRRYDVVGVGASLSPQPSQAQISAVVGHSEDPTNVSRAGSAGVALGNAGGIGSVAGIAGGAAMQFAYYKGLEAIKAWQDAMPLAGATVLKSPMRAMLYFTLAVAAAVVIGLVALLAGR
ncbi:hypothetical protein AAHB33_15400 [Paenarthrobacter sp. S56]|uniref:hypothetical protein n=1 Tax=Paenarthrobacter sp. S56 TaxID=3138179 RepID=UPI00321B56B0